MKKVTDIDIDFADRDLALALVNHIPASLYNETTRELKPHNVGVYLHDVPVDPITRQCSIEYKTAERHGFFKMDFLNVGVYEGIKDPAHLEQLLQQEPLWDLLEDEDFVNGTANSDGLFHLSGHYDVVSQMKPRSIMQVAMVLAAIRPAKVHLIGKSWSEVEADIWVPDPQGRFQFKKSHAVSYAMVIAVQMNLKVERALEDTD